MEPAAQAVAARLFVLTTRRPGSAKYRPTVATFYETSLVTSLFEFLLMSPVLINLEIRHEMKYKKPGKVGAPKRVDLWLRQPNGGRPHLIEAGDYTAKKVHADLKKLKNLDAQAYRWFLAFFRKQDATDAKTIIETAFTDTKLDTTVVGFEPSLATTFTVYRPNGTTDSFGVALLRGK
jgi:hypothetical protein